MSLILFVVNVFFFALGRKNTVLSSYVFPSLYSNRTLPEITHRVYFEIEVDGKSVGKVVFGLFGKNAPEAAENFRALATCEKGNGPITGKPLCYKGTQFHRIIPNFMLQGGDFTHGDGTGGESIYSDVQSGARHFTARMRELTKFNRPHMLATAGPPGQVGSQFFVTTVKAQWLTGKHVIFGTVLEGKDVVEELEKYGTYGGKPRGVVTIVECGEEPLKKEDKEPHY